MMGPSFGPLSIVLRKDMIELSLLPKFPDLTLVNRYFIASLTRIDVVTCHGFIITKLSPVQEWDGQGNPPAQFIRIAGPLWSMPFADMSIDGIETWAVRKEGRMQELWSALVSVGAIPASPPPTDP
jgi:hypothetical protein